MSERTKPEVTEKMDFVTPMEGEESALMVKLVKVEEKDSKG